MTSPDPRFAVQDQRLDTLEKRADSAHEKLHGVDSLLASIRMQTELLEQEVKHLKRDYYAGLAEQRQEVKDLLASLQLQDKENTEARLAREKLRAKQDETIRMVRWIFATVSTIGVGTAITVLSGFAT